MRDTLRTIKVYLLSDAEQRLVLWLRLMNYFSENGLWRLAKWASRRIQRNFCVFISHKARISRTASFRHPTGVVIGDGVLIGENVLIYQNVTLGGARVGDAQKNNYPEIGDGTVIFAGAVVVGKIKVGRNCVIGANSVVLNDIPDNSTAAGAPAKVVKSKSRDELMIETSEVC